MSWVALPNRGGRTCCGPQHIAHLHSLHPSRVHNLSALQHAHKHIHRVATLATLPHCQPVQGYNLDYMSNEDLGELIGSLTQAVERVRITVQLRRLATKKGAGGANAHSLM